MIEQRLTFQESKKETSLDIQLDSIQGWIQGVGLDRGGRGPNPPFPFHPQHFEHLHCLKNL